ncbi:MAG: hypothetical protein ACR2G2_06895 [Pseudonocardia sp.]
MTPASRRAELAARAATVAAVPGSGDHDRPAELPVDEPRVPRTRPVRVTVELSPMEHKQLRRWCAETSADLDLPVVAGAEVFRALLSLMREHPEVAEQVRAELARTGGSRRRH